MGDNKLDIVNFFQNNEIWVNIFLILLVFCSIVGGIMSFNKDNDIRQFGYIGMVMPLFAIILLYQFLII